MNNIKLANIVSKIVKITMFNLFSNDLFGLFIYARVFSPFQLFQTLSVMHISKL
jgi:hypothetical protein